MGRSGYAEGCDSPIVYLWDSILQRSIDGKRGQKMLRDLVAALEAMPVKRLCPGNFVAEGEFCTLGVLAVSRGVDVAPMQKAAEDARDDYMLEDRVRRVASKALDIAPSLAAAVMYLNDDDPCGAPEAPEARWRRMHQWATRHLKKDASG